MEQPKRIVAIGADDAGFHLKEIIKQHLESQGVEVVDYGPATPDPIDYPDVAAALAKDIAARKFERGILICGTGIGMAITANKVLVSTLPKLMIPIRLNGHARAIMHRSLR